jgi:hypothetical protein
MRKLIEYTVDYLVKTSPSKTEIKWKEIRDANFLNDNDVFMGLKWVEQEKLQFFGDGLDKEYEYALFLGIGRTRLENDEEYVVRLKSEQMEIDKKEKQEYETYLILKAKYEK